MLTIEAPAKINLTLEVIGNRPDGYHDIRSIVQTLNFSDSLQFAHGKDIRFNCDLPGWSAELSVILKAVKLLQTATCCKKGAAINITKRIPLMSGLGGDSSNAAAGLQGLNQLWELGLTRADLLKIAPQLGSDVPFFLYGGMALIEGRGEKISPLPPVPRRRVILIFPNVPQLPGKTQRLYSLLRPAHYTDGKITEQGLSELKSGKFADALLFNTFEKVVFARGEEMAVYRDHILKIGAPNLHLAGSGPTLFSLMEEKSQAEELLARLKNEGMNACLTETVTCHSRESGNP